MEDKKYPIGGYAPGNYHCRCGTCERSFFGDKPGHWIALGLQLRISVKLDEIIEWLDESGTAAATREEDAVSFADWVNDNYIKCGDEMKWTPLLGNRRETFTIGQVYDIFKQNRNNENG